jgi:hypothetical protein
MEQQREEEQLTERHQHCEAPEAGPGKAGNPSSLPPASDQQQDGKQESTAPILVTERVPGQVVLLLKSCLQRKSPPSR